MAQARPCFRFGNIILDGDPKPDPQLDKPPFILAAVMCLCGALFTAVINDFDLTKALQNKSSLYTLFPAALGLILILLGVTNRKPPPDQK